jgi:phospholipid/cholesterol/gamma-HCH transport system permease protein
MARQESQSEAGAGEAVQETAGSLVQAVIAGHPVLRAGGAWTARHAGALEDLVDQAAGTSALAIDLSGLERLDTYGGWLIERLSRGTGERAPLKLVGLPERFRDLMEDMQRTNRVVPAEPRGPGGIIGALDHVGRLVVEIGDDLKGLFRLFGQVAMAFVSVLRGSGSFRFTSIVHHLDRVALRAVPIIVLISLLIGAIIAQQGIFHFSKFGAETYVVDMIGILVLRELGVLLVSIMVAGRSGSAYTAELGSMKMREEMDALRTMGFDPIEVLVLPRLIALVIGLPLLAFIGNVAALFGGGLVAWLYGGLEPAMFIHRLHEAIGLNTFQVGMYKAPVMALVIGIVACMEGLKVKGSAESLGDHVTAAVVKSIFLVLVLDGFFAIFFASINM